MSDLERLSFEIEKAPYDEFREAKKRFRLTFGELLQLMITHTNFDKLADEAAEIRAARKEQDTAVSSILRKLPKHELEKLAKKYGS